MVAKGAFSMNGDLYLVFRRKALEGKFNQSEFITYLFLRYLNEKDSDIFELLQSNITDEQLLFMMEHIKSKERIGAFRTVELTDTVRKTLGMKTAKEDLEGILGRKLKPKKK